MVVRRIITEERAGSSVFAADSLAPARSFESILGFTVDLVWATAHNVRTGDPDYATSSIVPLAGETRLLVVTFPPDSTMLEQAFDPIAATAEYAEKLPGLAEAFEPDHPGMHKTPTIDYAILLDGELWLELDDGGERCLCAGDIVVQRGTRHAWRNKDECPARLAVMLIGSSYGDGREHAARSNHGMLDPTHDA